MKKVLVLMSAYNGEKYIAEQINSIFSQEKVQIELLIRDDGSTDQTINIIKEETLKYNGKLTLITGQNVGYEKSFLKLLCMAKSADFYAFSDQDDVWDNNKIYIAVQYIDRAGSSPALYYSNARVTNKKLQYSHELQLDNEGNCNQICKILNTGAMGCTIVINHNLLKILQLYTPQRKWPHDYWLLTVALYVGKAFYDPTSHMSYRQHEDNVTGGDIGIKNKGAKLIKSIRGYYQNRWSDLATEILCGYSNFILPEDAEMLSSFRDYRTNKKVKYHLLFNRNIKKENLLKNILFKLSILINKA